MIVPKPHTWLEIDAAAFNHNIQLYRKLIGPHNILSVVIKSNAYGHGIIEMGRLCEQHPTVDWMCTSTLSEALLLRSQGITKPLLVLSIVDQDPALAALHDIDLPIFDQQMLQELNSIGHSLNKKIAVHIKIDTGMSRFGFNPQEALAVIQETLMLPFILINGIFTHCVESGNPDIQFTLQQCEQFNRVCTQLQQQDITIPFRHAANSAATSTVNTLFDHFNFVRIGAGAYGLWHFREQTQAQALPLQQILSWKTRVTHIKEVPAHTPIGYDRTSITTRPTTLATIPVGYYDGYDRRLSNQGIVRIANRYYAQVVGRICMNATIIAIPENESVQLNDEVTLLGNFDRLRAYDIANLIGSFNAREITTRISSTLQRTITQLPQQHTTAKNIDWHTLHKD